MTISHFIPHHVFVVFGGIFICGGLATSCGAPVSRDRHSDWLANVRTEVVSASAEGVGPKNEGRWICVTGDVSACEAEFTDAEYGVMRRCFALKRRVEVYRTDGGENAPPDNWCAAELNDPPALRDCTWRVQTPKLGAYTLSADLLHDYWKHVAGIDGADPKSESKANPPDWDRRLSRQFEVLWPKAELPEQPPAPWRSMPDGRHWFLGGDPARPRHLDRRISYSVAQFPDRSITVLARQRGNSLGGDPESSGGGRHFTCIRPGKLSPDEMFGEAARDNEVRSEEQRVGGFLGALVGAGFILFGSIASWRLSRLPPPSPDSQSPKSETP